MVGVLSAAILLAGMVQAPARENRITFYKALKNVKEGWSKQQVKALLGPPDDVWSRADPSAYVGSREEVWCYGTQGHLTLPVLGRIRFRKGKVEYDPADYQPPPPLSLISDAELFRHMRAIARRSTPWNQRLDPLYLIQAAADLWPLGKEKALAVMKEYTRQSGVQLDNTMFWLVRVLFAPKDPPGFFAVPSVGAITPSPPKDLRRWPDFPLLQADGVPYTVYWGVLLGGYPEPFAMYVDRDGGNWVLRDSPPRPPDDPFPSFQKARRLPQFKLAESGQEWHYPSLEGFLLAQTLTLVRTAWRTKDLNDALLTKADYDRLHAAFLKVGARWDPGRRVYVRADGSFTPDPSDRHPRQVIELDKTPGLEFTLSVERVSDREVEVTGEYEFSGKGKAPKVSIDVYGSKVTEGQPGAKRGNESSTTLQSGGSSEVFNWPKGTRKWIVVRVDGRKAFDKSLSP